MFRVNFLLLITFVLTLPICCATAQESTASPDTSSFAQYSFTLNQDGRVTWTLEDSTGAALDFAPDEQRRILREICFPKALERAEAGKTPDLWTVGYFYINGDIIEKDLDAAGVAFRRGLKFDRPQGFLFLAGVYHLTALAEEREDYFQQANDMYLEALAANLDVPAASIIPLAGTYVGGWYGVKVDLEKADKLLTEAQKAHPEDPLVQLAIAKLRYHQKRYSEAIDSAEIAQQGLVDLPEQFLKARSYKFASALRGGMISRIDAKEFMSMGLTAPGMSDLTGSLAWTILAIFFLAFLILLWRTRRSWTKEPRKGPGIRLTLCWILVAIFGVGIGFIITLPGLDNLLGRWIGAIVILVACLIAVFFGGWQRYFGPAPICTGRKGFLIGLAIIVGCIVGQLLVTLGYQEIYKLVMGKAPDQQLVTLFMKSENLWQLAGILFIVGIAIPFYEEVLFRGFLFDSVNRRWGSITAFVVSSVVFAVVHGPVYAVPLMFLAFALGWARMKTGNLKMSFLIHAANNSFATLLMYFGSP